MRRELFAASLVLLAASASCAAPEDIESQAAAVSSSATRAPTHGSLGGRICSWNMRRLGHNFDGLAKDFVTAAQIIKDFCDVVAVEEVMQTSGNLTPGYDTLLTTLGSAWSGMITEDPRPNTTSSNSERYAFYWRESVATVCDGWTAGAQYITDTDDAFLREPAYTCLKVRDHDGELLIGAYHALYGSTVEREREVATIDDDRNVDGKKDDIIREIRSKRPRAAVLLMGDFNLTTTQLAAALPTYKDVTNGLGSTINDNDEITTNQYDHLVVAPDEEILPLLEPAESLDVRSYATRDKYYRTVSDHLPIRITLRK